jgi:AraC-like DNA-binding protein
LKQIFNWDNLLEMNSSPKDTEFLPLQNALNRILLGLESSAPPPIMLAVQTMEEFKSQKLPDHCKVRKRKIHGPRVPFRGRRRISNPAIIARWPQDGLMEGTWPALLFVLDGEADIHLVNYMVHSRAGDIMFLPARIPKLDGLRPHYEKVTPESHCDLLFLSFISTGLHTLEAHICHSRGDQHLPPGIGENCWFTSRAICLLFDAISEITQNDGSDESTFYLVAAVVSLFKQVVDQGKCFTNRDFPSQSLSLDNRTPISKALEYIQNHLNRPLSIDLVARWVGLSRTVFIRNFRDETNESFKEYLTRLRLEQAKVLLRQTTLPVDHISDRVGLSSGQLRNLFHEKCQCTPKEFRLRQRKD